MKFLTPGGARGSLLAAQYAASVFLGAFLLFQVQPLLAKAILPWFGGAPAVWTACLLFFQTLLLGGYLYAHLLTSYFKPGRQALIHSALVLGSLAFLNILPSGYWRPSGDEQPVVLILALLAANIGVPYLVLAANSPLMQAWFSGAARGRSPYRLYALSNAGSLLALLSYPFVVEPLLALKEQALVWAGCYVLFAAVCVRCAIVFARSQGKRGAEEAIPEGRPKIQAGEMFIWLLLAACASALLMATTNRLTQDVASVPFLWVLPLALYLLSFILCFEGERWYSRGTWTVFLVFACAGAAYLPGEGVELPLVMQVLMYCLTLFVACMVCHGELAARKPPPARLTGFYLVISLGGAVGGLLVAVAAPLALDGPWEYHLAWLALASAALYLLAVGKKPLLRPDAGGLAWALLLAMYGGLMYAMQENYKAETSASVAMGRNFYGTLHVFDSECGGDPVRTLMHGQIEHGFQFAPGDPRSNAPVSYYAPETGAGIAVLALRGRLGARKRPLRMGLVGLGAGIMAAWGQSGDKLIFYEINPLVERFSREYFSYLEDCPAEVEVVIGDARLSLEREAAAGAPPLDLLVLDAFTSDAIPLHLLTTEAFESYFKRLRPGGVLAVHISNRFLDLEPLARGLALRAGKEAVLIDSLDDEKTGAAGSTWVLVTSDASFLAGPLVAGKATPWREGRPTLVFSDRYSNLFRLIKHEWPGGWLKD